MMQRIARSQRSALARASSTARSASRLSTPLRPLQSSTSSSTSSTEPLSSHLTSPFMPHSLGRQTRSLHISSCRLNAEKKEEPKTDDSKTDESKTDESKKDEETKDEKKEEKKEEMPPPPPHGDKTPWEVFRETMQAEFQKSQEWNESTKALASSAHEFSESESVRKAREAYEKSTGAVSQAASTVVKTTATAVGKGAQWTWETPVVRGVRVAANATGDVLDKATKPLRETEAYKDVKNVIDDGSSARYGGWVEKEERRKRRAAQMAANPSAHEVLQENPDAGTNITLHKDAAWKEAWREFRDTSKVAQGFFNMNKAYQESENPLISTARSITDTIAGFFAENEQALVIKKFKQMDPNFRIEPFLNELRDYILPEVLDAYVKGDVATLKEWLSAAQFSVYEAVTKQYLTMGMKSDGRILDIRNVDVLKARMLDPGEVPVFIITCRTQEVHFFKNAKTNQLAAGMEDKVQLVTYAIGITRTPEDVNNPETRGWRIIEMQKSGRDWY
ncbi:hypothetical protein TD95_001763 [Thielaviopsis punctulata]|uniref:Mitochondrial import inner membrane translocase subunit TIM44 n=1 Tax=Thielaviopsis punctulata TaxID=72032 RepID=A0A0F4Z884_9PEZI|nr:hypothetical protein TD95_001763 [Thielaviopsis punctulata]